MHYHTGIFLRLRLCLCLRRIHKGGAGFTETAEMYRVCSILNLLKRLQVTTDRSMNSPKAAEKKYKMTKVDVTDHSCLSVRLFIKWAAFITSDQTGR